MNFYRNPIVGILLMLMMSSACNPKKSNVEFETYYCDAETVRGTNFTGGSSVFSNGASQSGDAYHSGKYSACLHENSPYGMSLTLSLLAGQYVYGKVWVKRDGNYGALILKSDKGNELVNQPLANFTKEGWECIEFGYLVDSSCLAQVFVMNGAEQKLYADDFEIKVYKSKPLPKQSLKDLQIELSDENYEKLRRYRNQALKRGILTGAEKKYVEGFINKDGQKLPIKLRLKGDWTDHISSDKWSLRIKLAKGYAYEGMITFSVQTPETRGFMKEWLAHEAFKSEGLLATDYSFKSVLINGKNMGVFALEEHFEKQLLESQNRREGPIFKFDEKGFWQVNKMLVADKKWFNLPTFLAADILAFSAKSIKNSETLSQSYEVGLSKMKAYQNFEENLSFNFDLDYLARYYALSDLLGINHHLRWHNMRLYYNPITSSLEHIAFDCFRSDQIEHELLIDFDTSRVYLQDNYLTYFVFNNHEFRQLYAQYFQKYSGREFISELKSKLNKEWENELALLRGEYPAYYLDLNFLDNRASELRSSVSFNPQIDPELRLKANEFDAGKPTLEYLKSSGLKVTKVDQSNVLRFKNFQANEVQITRIKERGKQVQKLENPIKIPGFSFGKNTLKIELSNKIEKVYFDVPGVASDLSVKVKDAIVYNVDSEVNKLPPFIKSNDMQKTCTISRGNYVVSEKVELPIGYNLIVEAGTNLDLVKGGVLIVRGNIIAEGKESLPIRFRSSDGAGEGLLVLSQFGKCSLINVFFDNLTAFEEDSWWVTGAVTIHNADVYMNNVTLSGNHCEDALNLVRCKFEIIGLTIYDTYADGFDADFCKGIISNSKLSNTGNDALDFSGSEVNVVNCNIQNAGDKGISGGEHSTLQISNSTISAFSICIASKDQSEVKITNSHLAGCNCGYGVYRKKPEYGPAQLNASAVELETMPFTYRLDLGSTVAIDNLSTTGKIAVNLDSIYAEMLEEKLEQ